MYLDYNDIEHKDMAEMKILLWRMADFFGIGIGVIAFIQPLGEWENLILFSASLIFFGFRVYMMYLDSRKKAVALEEQEWDLYQKKIIKGKITGTSMLISHDLAYFNEIKKCVDDVFARTKADRFLILIMTNGRTKKKFATVRYEQHKDHPLAYLSINAAERYVNFEFDEKCEQMITDSEHKTYVNLITEFMPEQKLKTIYTDEKITHGEFYFLARQPINEEKDEISTCSFATHSGIFSPHENAIIQNNVNIIRNKTKQLFN